MNSASRIGIVPSRVCPLSHPYTGLTYPMTAPPAGNEAAHARRGATDRGQHREVARVAGARARCGGYETSPTGFRAGTRPQFDGKAHLASAAFETVRWQATIYNMAAQNFLMRKFFR
jgi:hypothetical protein